MGRFFEKDRSFGDRDSSSRERDSPPPVKEGDIIDVKIESKGEKGDGIARISGFVIFVPGTKEGDEVKIKITKVLRKVGFAEVAGKSRAKASESAEEEAESEENAAEEKPKEIEEEPEEISDSEDF